MGLYDQTVDTVPPENRRGGLGNVTGVHGGHDIDIRRFPANGVILLGHLRAVETEKLTFALDVEQTLARADESCHRLLRSVDERIQKMGLDAHEPDAPLPGPIAPTTPVTLDLRAAGITSVVWATGFRNDFGWVHLPVFDDAGQPIHRRGVTHHAGMYFLGLRWLYTLLSGFLPGVGKDAAYLAEHIIASR